MREKAGRRELPGLFCECGLFCENAARTDGHLELAYGELELTRVRLALVAVLDGIVHRFRGGLVDLLFVFQDILPITWKLTLRFSHARKPECRRRSKARFEGARPSSSHRHRDDSVRDSLRNRASSQTKNPSA